jgi:hypothetical protein
MGLLAKLNLSPPAPAPEGESDVLAESGDEAAGSDFKPEFEIPEHPNMTAPVQVPQGEEVGVELVITNWQLAPKDAAVMWRSMPYGAQVKLDLDPRTGSALLSMKGGQPSSGLIRSFIDIKTKGRVSTFELPTLFVIVNPSGPIDPAEQSEDHGGPATVTDLEQDMGIFMGPWLTAALAGVTQFTTNALSDEIDDLSSGSMDGFFMGILGNTAWAATCFFPAAGALRIFAVSMAGIAAAAVPSVPHASKSHIPEVQKAMNAYLFDIFGKLTPKFRTTAQGIIDKKPDIRRYEALTLFAKASLVPGCVRIDPSFKQKPKLNLQYISDRMESKASEELKGWVARQKAEKQKRDTEELIRKTSRRQPGEI